MERFIEAPEKTPYFNTGDESGLTPPSNCATILPILVGAKRKKRKRLSVCLPKLFNNLD